MTQLYRLFDGEGVLLYIGISEDWTKRLRQHRRSQPWADEIANCSSIELGSRSAAEKAERSAIRCERPRYNKAHSEQAVTAVPVPRLTKLEWRCETCRQLIRDGEGYLWVSRIEVAQLREIERANRGRLACVSGDELLRREVLGRWKIQHGACDTQPNADLYWIGVERMRTVSHALEWTAHLHGKGWHRFTDWSQVMYSVLQQVRG